MKKGLGFGLLSFFMTTSALADTVDGPEFQKRVTRGFSDMYVPIDCDTLGPNGRVTAEFVKQMGLKNHMDAEERRLGPNASESARIEAFKRHLASHNISRQAVDNLVSESAQICREQYL